MSHTSTEDITREDGSKEMEKGGGGGGWGAPRVYEWRMPYCEFPSYLAKKTRLIPQIFATSAGDGYDSQYVVSVTKNPNYSAHQTSPPPPR